MDDSYQDGYVDGYHAGHKTALRRVFNTGKWAFAFVALVLWTGVCLIVIGKVR